MPPTSPTSIVFGVFASKRTAGFGKPVPPVNVHVPIAFSPVVADTFVGALPANVVVVAQICWLLPAETKGCSSIQIFVSS